jgi:hypothetical protein
MKRNLPERFLAMKNGGATRENEFEYKDSSGETV